MGRGTGATRGRRGLTTQRLNNRNYANLMMMTIWYHWKLDARLYFIFIPMSLDISDVFGIGKSSILSKVNLVKTYRYRSLRCGYNGNKGTEWG